MTYRRADVVSPQLKSIKCCRGMPYMHLYQHTAKYYNSSCTIGDDVVVLQISSPLTVTSSRETM